MWNDNNCHSALRTRLAYGSLLRSEESLVVMGARDRILRLRLRMTVGRRGITEVVRMTGRACGDDRFAS